MSKNKESIWFRTPRVEEYLAATTNTAMTHCGVELVEIGPDFIKAKMPVDARTHQPAGLLHGGMSVMLAESVASWAASLVVDNSKYSVVGQEINANHLRSVRSGWVYGTARPIYLGGKSQVWEVQIENEEGKLVCISRMTAAILTGAMVLKNQK